MPTRAHPIDETTIRRVLQEYRDAYAEADADRVAALYADDAELRVPDGRFVGRESVAAYLRWSYARFSHVRTEDRGFGTQVCGATAIEEYAVKATMSNDMTGEVPALAVSEFDNDGKIRRRHIYWDNWPWIRQGALSLGGVAGFFGRGFVSKTDEAMTKGMPSHD